MKTLFLLFVFSTLSVSAKAEIPQNNCGCAPQLMKFCTVEDGNGMNAVCGSYKTVVLHVLNAQGKEVAESKVLKDVCQEKAEKILNTAVCN